MASAKDGSAVAILSQECAGLLRLAGPSLICATAKGVIAIEIATGATRALPGPGADKLLADGNGMFALVNYREIQGDSLVFTSSGLIDLTTGEEIAHAGFPTYALALDGQYLYWAPFDQVNPAVLRVPRRR